MIEFIKRDEITLSILASIMTLSIIVLLVSLLNELVEIQPTSQTEFSQNLDLLLQPLEGKCFTYHQPSYWWTYQWCHRHSVLQYHVDDATGEPDDDGFRLGEYDARKTQRSQEIGVDFFTGGDHCQTKSGKNMSMTRRAEVQFMCCASKLGDGTYIKRVRERGTCDYAVKVCSEFACLHLMEEHLGKAASMKSEKDQPAGPSQEGAFAPEPIDGALESKGTLTSKSKPSKTTPTSKKSSNRYRRFFPKDSARTSRSMTDQEVEQAKEDVKSLFYHAYDGYMENGFPAGEVLPVTCQGVAFELCKLPMVTLIDTLDTLLILGNATEFERAVWLVVDHADFALDLNVSVFETNIRVLGGLLSAHTFAESHVEFQSEREYNGELLDLAQDIGERLLPAFNTKTGIPYGTVNLLSGIPPGETPIASTAGGGSLSLEFSVLSALTGNSSFGDAATRAVKELYARKSRLDLLGKHIDVGSGRWTEGLSGIGSNSDSFYEYLIKMYCMFGDEEYYQMFLTTYGAIERYNRIGDWYNDVDMNTGAVRRRRFENLMAFWPGMQLLVGDIQPALRTLNAMYKVWRNHGFIPEEFDFVKWELVTGGTSDTYPLRPELIESTMHMYMVTQDKSWLWAGRDFLDSLEYARVDCGFATVNVQTLRLQDAMPSFFLAETAKYLYLLFDEDNFIHRQPYIFSTEAHPFLASDFLPDGQQCMVNSILPFVDQALKNKPIDSNSAPKKAQTGKQMSFAPADDRYTDSKPKFNFDIHALWEHEEYLRNQQSPVLPWWEETQYYTFYSDSKTGHRGVDYSSDNSLQAICPGHTYGLPDLSVQRPDETLHFDFGADLGVFEISASQTGFSVISDKTGEVMDISLLGKGLLFIRDHAEEQQGAVIADRQSNSVYCYVSVIINGEEDRFPCAVAAFGPTGELDEVEPVQAELVIPTSNPELCTAEASENIRNKIVLVERGTCMFETKTSMAESQGAAAVIILNNQEDGEIFVMAGVEITGLWKGKSKTSIPTVMISKDFGIHLKRIKQKLEKKNKDVVIEVNVVKKKIQSLEEYVEALDSNIHFPQVFAFNQNTIYVMGQGTWGVMLVTKTGVDWQLVVIEKESFFDPEDSDADGQEDEEPNEVIEEGTLEEKSREIDNNGKGLNVKNVEDQSRSNDVVGHEHDDNGAECNSELSTTSGIKDSCGSEN